MQHPAAHKPYLFAEFELDPLRRALLKGGRPVALNPKAFEVLLALVERRADVLSKDELLSAVWPDQIVEKNNLTVHIWALRKALGEQKGAHQLIVTIPGRGYRFVADVGRPRSGDQLVIERHAVTHVTVEEEEDSGAEGAAAGKAAERWEASVLEAGPRAALSPAAAGKTRAAKIVAATAVVAALVAVVVFVAHRRFGAGKGATRFERGVEDGTRINSFELPASVTNRLTRWTPDGHGLVFISTVGGVSNLRPQPADGGGARQITDFITHRIEAFDFARDGRGLAVVRSIKTSDAVLLGDRP